MPPTNEEKIVLTVPKQGGGHIQRDLKKMANKTFMPTVNI